MRPVTELILPYMAIEDPEFAKDPIARLDAARSEHPWLAKTAYGYIVTEYAAIRDLLGMDARMRPPHEIIINAMNAKGSRWERFQLDSLLAIHGEDHKRIRDVVAPMFTPRAANQHRPLMRQVISRVLDEWGPKGRFDFEEFASYFPITVMCTLLGASPSIIPGLRSSLEALGLSFNLISGFLPQLENACEVLEHHLARLIAERRAGRRSNAEPDLLDALLEARDGGGISEGELTSLLIFLFVAGYDTSKNVLTFIMHEMLARPAMYERCAADADYCRKVVEESLRYRSPGTSARLTNEDLAYRDVLIPKDTMLFLPNGIAGRDPSAAPDPDTFDPERQHVNRHLAFGRGMHICLGQFIARAQIEEGLHQIAQRIKEPRLAGPYGYRPFPGVWGLRGLPIEFRLEAAK
ncbi:MAG TPA: cytochrome P450 [Steroidobacteraceae bacterium]|nr:cytochrome P450 [Steroidobacteraceae bacterium]